MSIEVIVLSTACAMLCAALVALNMFWGRQVQKLIDKVMSRNYAEYTHVNAPPAPPREMRIDLGQAEDYRSLEGIHPLA